jgi:hypothetical protein
MLETTGLGESFDAFWQDFERLNADQSAIAGRYGFEFIPGFATQLQNHLYSRQKSDRLRSLKLICALSLHERYQLDIFTSANDSWAEIRSVAMTALGRLGGETSRRILERALHDPIPSVQAAAIDALDEMAGRRRIESVGPKTNSEDAEVRAAAVRCLLRMHEPTAVAALVDMLHDRRIDHRSAGLWLVDQLNLAALLPRIREVAEGDADARIARVAHHVAQRLERRGGALPLFASVEAPV